MLPSHYNIFPNKYHTFFFFLSNWNPFSAYQWNELCEWNMTIFIHTCTYFRQSVPKNRGNLFKNRIIHKSNIFLLLAFINAFRMIPNAILASVLRIYWDYVDNIGHFCFNCISMQVYIYISAAFNIR